ncbi:hypothetical protein PODOV005v1_20003 [Vibrio phage PS32B.2]|nr:hypothetical protein PODOV005v1_20003 [Vibrio phage PS32B.2]QZI86301.1 hypothetical protein PODOV028v1_10010 [Vibrio phage PS32B.3]QZI86396.1 hypothetical protein PODOV029v1_30003 [Vibrio phage PS35B.1]QZI86454.1 hypothetical protein PODOV027v1_10045 [Vibrio phage PS35B.3]QZI92190.1 hypothetical protein PODOV026v1_p0017 [Vibrio phage PS32B.1]QZI92295.1 hypothetical protein PODOV004v1_p0060 [Vibrio phage PS32B.11]QZI92314.1 hypothetical protein PODOV025v1_p0017 [Vibrio phage PS32B.6]
MKKKTKGIIASFYAFIVIVLGCLAVAESNEVHGIKDVAIEKPLVQTINSCDASNDMFDSSELEGIVFGASQKRAINAYLCKPIEEVIVEQPNIIIEPHRVYSGEEAVHVVEQQEGALTPEMIRVVLDEGYVMGEYHDVGEIYASGVGQTGKFKDMSFKQSFAIHEERAVTMFPLLHLYSEELRANLISSTYRGSMSGSPKTRMLINQGRFDEASREFLNNREYKEAKRTGSGVAKRMERVANAIKNEPAYRGQLQKE